MNKITIISVIIAIVVLGGIIWIARPAPYGTGDSPSGPDSQTGDIPSSSLDTNGIFGAEEINFDFGTVSMAKGVVKHAYKIRNAGSEPVIIGKMYTSCMCTTATLIVDDKRFGPYGMPGHGFTPKINKTMDTGKEAVVEIVFDPAAHGPAGVGRIQRTITIENNAGQPLELEFTALVTP